MKKSFFIRTFGCQMNMADSDTVQEHLRMKGFAPAVSIDQADILFINTCTVRQHAEDRAVSYIGRCRKWKQEKPGRMIIMMGCVVERLGKELKQRFPFIDHVISSKDVHAIPEILNNMWAGGPVPVGADYTRWVTIIRGCSNNCSYCIVPRVRGEEVSLPAHEILDTIKKRVSAGMHEFTLLGQNVNAYHNGMTFAELLDSAACLPGVRELSFITSHPKNFPEEVMNVMASHENISRNLHLPVQSGSDRILSLMKRGYTRAAFIELVHKLRGHIPTMRLSTDIIVGFPGESDEDFNDTVSLLEPIHVVSAFVFKYSPRAGTAASVMHDSVPLSVKEERNRILLDILKKRARAYAAQ